MSNDFDLANFTDGDTATAYDEIEVGDLIRFRTSSGTETREVVDFDKHGRPLVEFDLSISTARCHVAPVDLVEVVDSE